MHDMRGRVADGAVRMRETSRMEMRLLDSRAEDEKDGAQEGEYESLACPVPAHSSHDYRILYAADLRFLVMAPFLLHMKHGDEVGARGG